MKPVSLRRSLSARLLWLTIGLVLVAEVLVFVPSLGRERRDWLRGHLRNANLTAYAVTAIQDGLPDAAERKLLLRISGDEMVRVTEHGRAVLALGQMPPSGPAARIDLPTETAPGGMWRALQRLFRGGDTLVELTGPSPLRPGAMVDVVFHDRALNNELRNFAREILVTSLATAGATGALVYLALLVLFVRPMRRIIDSIAAFRADPEHGTPLDAEAVSVLANDEMAVAGRELSAMQQELRAALWRNARLAALGTAVAKVGHDLRNILTPATIAAERLANNPDPKVARSGQTVIQAVDRATELVHQTLDFAREGPPAVDRATFGLRELVREAIESVTAAIPQLAARNDVAPDLQVEADRMQLFRVLLNLLRNAAEAGARGARIGAGLESNGVSIRIEDNGPGLPKRVRENLFRPFLGSARHGGSGLGMAIARDLMRAHGGDIELVATGSAGTRFRLDLPLPQAARQAAPEAGEPVGPDGADSAGK